MIADLPSTIPLNQIKKIQKHVIKKPRGMNKNIE